MTGVEARALDNALYKDGGARRDSRSAIAVIAEELAARDARMETVDLWANNWRDHFRTPEQALDEIAAFVRQALETKHG